MDGTVLRLIRDKGFGFIKGQDGGEYFFHKTGVRGGTPFDNMEIGDKVTFSPTDGNKGLRADDVRSA